jgi:hypothetical protein
MRTGWLAATRSSAAKPEAAGQQLGGRDALLLAAEAARDREGAARIHAQRHAPGQLLLLQPALQAAGHAALVHRPRAASRPRAGRAATRRP